MNPTFDDPHQSVNAPESQGSVEHLSQHSAADEVTLLSYCSIENESLASAFTGS
jgi:hypothetical protein